MIRACRKCGGDLFAEDEENQRPNRRICAECKKEPQVRARYRKMVKIMGKWRRFEDCTVMERIMCFRDPDPWLIAEDSYRRRIKRRDANDSHVIA